MKPSDDDLKGVANRRKFINTALNASLFLPLVLRIPRALLEPLFRKEQNPQPVVETPDQTWNQGFAAVFHELESNLQGKTAFIWSRWARPAPRFFSTYLWETCFISMVWGLWMPDIGLEIFEPFLARQRMDGRIPYEVNPVRSSAITQPPLLAWAMETLSRKKIYTEFLKGTYPALVRYYRWLRKDRFRDGFYFWGEPFESGMESSPRFFVKNDEFQPVDMKRFIPVDLNSEVLIQLRSMATLSKMVGKPNDSKAYLRDADILAARINRQMWNERDGMYYDIYDGAHLRVPTIASFFPMTAGVPSETQVAALVNVLLDTNRFWTPMPFPTVAKNDPRFKLDTWQGPVWLSTSYMVIRGLENCGRRDIAAEAAYRVVSKVFGTWNKSGHFYEFYNPNTGDINDVVGPKENIMKSLILGERPVKDFVGSTGLVNNLLVEDILGIRWKDTRPIFEPALPPEWLGKTIRYKSPYLKLDCSLKLEEPDKARLRITAPYTYETVLPNVVPWRK